VDGCRKDHVFRCADDTVDIGSLLDIVAVEVILICSQSQQGLQPTIGVCAWLFLTIA
jgi:hypothetical protein